ncbi:hypothetical protein OG439_06015 [Amycolatopsis sp. NBC_01307]|uniref:hypothetical protein n=1 Tax=Amycolatopsis sp. NBC_01307 TaxID=2903561 RepID=UPI002E109A2E|nr:hypothetical protein OG439_06015 [Amycolatopsis sp. NBC_01307]
MTQDRDQSPQRDSGSPPTQEAAENEAREPVPPVAPYSAAPPPSAPPVAPAATPPVAPYSAAAGPGGFAAPQPPEPPEQS